MKKASLIKSGLFSNHANAATGYDEYVTGLTALAGGGQSGATALTGVHNVIGTCATGGDSVLLPVADQGDEIWVRNDGAATANVYPQTGGKINNGSANAAASLLPGQTGLFKARGTLDWSFVKIGGTTTTGITAHAGGGQGSATALTTKYNIVATCATGGDSVILPPGVALDDEIIVDNQGAASCNVFPQSGGAIRGLSANTALALANGKTGVYRSLGGGNWVAVVSA